jgi:hypothetical protein
LAFYDQNAAGGRRALLTKEGDVMVAFLSAMAGIRHWASSRAWATTNSNLADLTEVSRETRYLTELTLIDGKAPRLSTTLGANDRKWLDTTAHTPSTRTP